LVEELTAKIREKVHVEVGNVLAGGGGKEEDSSAGGDKGE